MNKNKIKFGDIIYRPCISYSGHKNFVNPSIVMDIIHREETDYILSYDVFRQSWTDDIRDLDVKIFRDKTKAEEALKFLIEKKKMQAK